MNGQHKDAGHVVERAWAFLLREVAHEMAAIIVVLCHDIEQEGFHVVVESLRTQEQLGEKTEVLTINWILTTIDFEEGVLAVAIDLITGRMLSWAFEL